MDNNAILQRLSELDALTSKLATEVKTLRHRLDELDGQKPEVEFKPKAKDTKRKRAQAPYDVAEVALCKVATRYVERQVHFRGHPDYAFATTLCAEGFYFPKAIAKVPAFIGFTRDQLSNILVGLGSVQPIVRAWRAQKLLVTNDDKRLQRRCILPALGDEFDGDVVMLYCVPEHALKPAYARALLLKSAKVKLPD